jgi:hypothetical protein
MITASTSIAMNVSGCAKFERCPGLRTEGVGAGRCATPAAGAVELDTVFADDVLYLEWKATCGGRKIEDAIDTFIFQNGMIRVQTIVYTVQSGLSRDIPPHETQLSPRRRPRIGRVTRLHRGVVSSATRIQNNAVTADRRTGSGDVHLSAPHRGR